MNASLRGTSTSAIRFWERGRIIYNAALLAVVAGIYALHPPSSNEEMSIDQLQAMFVLAVLANVSFCVAYPIDILVQLSGHRVILSWARWIVLLVGTLFACVLAEFIARGMFGYSI